MSDDQPISIENRKDVSGRVSGWDISDGLASIIESLDLRATELSIAIKTDPERIREFFDVLETLYIKAEPKFDVGSYDPVTRRGTGRAVFKAKLDELDAQINFWEATRFNDPMFFLPPDSLYRDLRGLYSDILHEMDSVGLYIKSKSKSGSVRDMMKRKALIGGDTEEV